MITKILKSKSNGDRLCFLRALLTLVAAAALGMSMHAAAEERTWVGESGGIWTDAANWSPSGVPKETDVLVFAPQDTLLVRIGDGTSTCKGGGFRFESGTTYFAYTNSSVAIYMGNVSNFFYVAEGASVFVTNRFMCMTAVNKAGHFVKTGKGRLVISTPGETGTQDFWTYAVDNNLAAVDFLEGETVLASAANYPLSSISLNVCSGATLRCTKTYHLRTDQRLHIEKGGVLDCGSVQQYASSITGDGVVTNHAGITMYLREGKCTFSGRFYRASGSNSTISFADRQESVSEEDWGFVIGTSNTLAKSAITVPTGEGNVVRFAAGVTNFWIGYVGGKTANQCLTLEDEDGCPVNVYGDLYQNGNDSVKFKGKGGAFFTTGRTITKTAVLEDFTGTLGVRTSGVTLNIGDNTAAGWPDAANAPLGAIEVTDGTLGVKNQNAGEAVFDMPFVGTNGRVDFNSDATLRQAWMKNAFWLVYANSRLTVAGGSTSFRSAMYIYNNSSLVLTNGASLCGTWAIPSYQSWTVLKQPTPMSLSAGDNTHLEHSLISVFDGCTIDIKGENMPRRFDIHPDGAIIVKGALFSSCPSSDPAVMTVNGGMFQVGTQLAPYNLDVTPDSDNFELRVGERGMHLDFDTIVAMLSTSHSKFHFKRGIKSGVDGGTDGGIVRTGGGWMFNWYPHEITGTFDNRDGVLSLPNKPTITGATTPMFGYGDFRLGNARLQYDDEISGAFSLKLATATGKAMYFDGASTLRQRNGSAKPSQNIEIGPSGAAQDSSLVRGGRGAAFFLWNDIVTGDPVDAGAVTVNGGLSTDTAGRIVAPVFHYVYAPDSTTWNQVTCRHLDFLSCDGDDRLAAFTGETAGLAGGAGSVAAVTASATLAESASVAALRVDGINGVNSAAKVADSPLTISSGATLSVGDGTNPAVVLLNNRSSQSTATIKGAGTLDFGTSEGLVALNRAGSAAAPARIDCTIAGSGGLSVVAPLDGGVHILGLGGANTFTGGTLVNGAFAWPTNAAAFASGTVTLGDGDVAGGGLLMATEGLVVPNAMRIAGCGPISTLSTLTTYGAVIFTKSGELSGNVEVYAPVRICASGEGVRGTFSGVLSGDSVQLWSCTGAIVLSGANTYTGGTAVVSSTLALAGNGTAGMGGIVLDSGTLRVENAAAKTIPNTVSGIGTLALAGSGAVTFESLASEEGRGFSLDVCGGDRELAGSLADIASITNSSSAHGVLAVASDGTWSGEVCHGVGIGVADGVRFRLGADATLPADARIYLGDGATLDLDGAERTVRTVYGNGTVVNGTLNETNPRGGMLLIVM